MKKIRIDNDFVFLWGIERNGVSESLVDASDVRLYLVSRWGKKALSDFRIEDGCRVRVELTPDVLSGCGEYRLELHYVLPDALLGDGGRRCAVDTDAFEIVPITAKADSGGEFSSVSDACAGFQGERGERGERGEPFVYSDFTAEQLAGLTPSLDFESVTYAELVQLRDNSKLKQGRWYAINDFCTVYKQPVSGEIIRCDIEPIVVFALSGNSLHSTAYSLTHPTDTLVYSLDNNQTIAPGSEKGYISRRTDDKRNSIPFDWRNVKFRRWQATADDWVEGKTYKQKDVVCKDGALYISTVNNNSVSPDVNNNKMPTVTSALWIKVRFPDKSYVLFDPKYVQNGLQFKTTGAYMDYHMFSTDRLYGTASDNVIDGVRGDIYSFSNTVFLDVYSDYEKAYPKVRNNIIGADFRCNTFMGSVTSNTFGDFTYFNLATETVANNKAKDHFRHNFINDYFVHNTQFCWELSYNIFGSTVVCCMFTGYAVWKSVVAMDIIYCRKISFVENCTFLGYIGHSELAMLTSCEFHQKIVTSKMTRVYSVIAHCDIRLSYLDFIENIKLDASVVDVGVKYRYNSLQNGKVRQSWYDNEGVEQVRLLIPYK